MEVLLDRGRHDRRETCREDDRRTPWIDLRFVAHSRSVVRCGESQRDGTAEPILRRTAEWTSRVRHERLRACADGVRERRRHAAGFAVRRRVLPAVAAALTVAR